MTSWIRKEVIGDATLYLGDCLETMPEIGVVNHIISDPPFEQVMHDLHSNAEYRRTDGNAQRKHFEFSGIDQIRPKLVNLVSQYCTCLLYTSPSPRDKRQSRMPSSA